jgi:hypothetical protein
MHHCARTSRGLFLNRAARRRKFSVSNGLFLYGRLAFQRTLCALLFLYIREGSVLTVG